VIDLRKNLDEAEAELRCALVAERAELKGAGMRRLRAEIDVDRARTALRMSTLSMRSSFGPGDGVS